MSESLLRRVFALDNVPSSVSGKVLTWSILGGLVPSVNVVRRSYSKKGALALTAFRSAETKRAHRVEEGRSRHLEHLVDRGDLPSDQENSQYRLKLVQGRMHLRTIVAERTGS